MKVQLRQREQKSFIPMLRHAYNLAVELHTSVYIGISLTSSNPDRTFYGQAPNVGTCVLAVVQHTAIPGIYEHELLEHKYMAFVAWPIICPDIAHGNGHAGGRYTSRGIEICNAVPCEVW